MVGTYTPMHKTLALPSPICDWITNWSDGIVVAGGIVHNVMMNDKISLRASDIDIFLTCSDASDATPLLLLPRIKTLLSSAFKRYQERSPLPMRVEFVRGVLEFEGIADFDDRIPAEKEDPIGIAAIRPTFGSICRKVQIIVKRVYSSVDSLLQGFDLPPCQMAVTGPDQVYATLAARYYMATGEILVSPRATVNPHRKEKYSRGYSNFRQYDPDIHPMSSAMHCQKSNDVDELADGAHPEIGDESRLKNAKRSHDGIIEEDDKDETQLQSNKRQCLEENSSSDKSFSPPLLPFIYANTWEELSAWLDSTISNIDFISYVSNPEYCIHGRQDAEHIAEDQVPCDCHIIPSRLCDFDVWPKELIPAKHEHKSYSSLQDYTEAEKGCDIDPQAKSDNIITWRTSSASGMSWCHMHDRFQCDKCSMAAFVRSKESTKIVTEYHRFESWQVRHTKKGHQYLDGPLVSATVGMRIGGQTTCPPLFPDCIIFSDTDNHAIRCLHLRSRFISTLYNADRSNHARFRHPYDVQWVDEKMMFVILAEIGESLTGLFHCDTAGVLYKTTVSHRVLKNAHTGLSISRCNTTRDLYNLHPRGITKRTWTYLVGSLKLNHYAVGNSSSPKSWHLSRKVDWDEVYGEKDHIRSKEYISRYSSADVSTASPLPPNINKNAENDDGNRNAPVGSYMVHTSSHGLLIAIDTSIYRKCSTVSHDGLQYSNTIATRDYFKQEWEMIQQLSSFCSHVNSPPDAKMRSSRTGPTDMSEWIACHREILRKWPYFVRLEASGMSEAQTGIVDFGDNLCKQSLEVICWILYTGDMRAYTLADPLVKKELEENAIEFELESLGIIPTRMELSDDGLTLK